MTSLCAERDRLELACGPSAASDAVAADRCRQYARALRSATLQSGLRWLAGTAYALVIGPIAARRRAGRQRARGRDELLQLGDRLLDDVGLTRLDVERATGRARDRGDGRTRRWLDDDRVNR